MSSKGRVNLPKGLSPKLVRESHVARSNHLRANGPIFMAYTMDRYLASTVECQESFRGHSRVTLNALDEMAAQDKVKAARGRGGRVRGGEDARGARRGAAWRGRVAGRMRQCRWTILGVCAACSSRRGAVGASVKLNRSKAGARGRGR